MKNKIVGARPAAPAAGIGVLGVVLGLAVVLATAQESKPNFSGEWKMNLEKSDFGQLPGPKSRTDKINHKEPDLKINRTTVTQADQTFASEWNCTTDGKECSNEIPGGVVLKSTAKWDGEALAVDSKGTFGQGEVQIKDRWTLSKDGKTLTIARHLISEMGEADQTFILDKQ